MLSNSKKLIVSTLIALILVATPSAFAGRLHGPASTVDRVMAFSTDTFTEVFRAGERARVVVDGDGDTDLDVFVYDENGNLIASDTDMTIVGADRLPRAVGEPA